jgi:hypothetical protein
MPDETSPPPPARTTGCLKWPSIAAVLIVGIISYTVLRGIDKFGSLLGFAKGAGTQQTITDTFRETIRKVTGTQGDILEVATLEADETFTRMDARTLAWNLIYLGTTVSEIRAPAVYRYHIKLSDAWSLSSHGTTCVVIAPSLRPSLPPAIRTDKMEKKTQAGWGRFNATQNLIDLEKSITPMLQRRAGNSTHIDSIREPARQAVAKFVQTWLIEHPQDPAIEKIVIVFPDEPGAKNPAVAAKLPATRVLP